MSKVGGPSRIKPLDVHLLSQHSRNLGEIAFAINSPEYGGVDTDGDKSRLQWEEFVGGGQRLLARYPHIEGEMMQLQQLLLQGFEPTPARTSGPASLDLNLLAQSAPELANVAFAMNSFANGGVNLDGDVSQLSWDEFLKAGPSFIARYPGLKPMMLRLQTMFEAPSQPAGKHPHADTPIGQAIGVDLSSAHTRPGLAQASGGVVLTTLKKEGNATLMFPFPGDTKHQDTKEDELSLLIVDQHGQPVDDAIISSALTPFRASHDKNMLQVELDLSKLPDLAVFRWQIPVEVSDQLADLTQPVPLSTLETLPKETKIWLGSSQTTQTDHPEIQELAAEIRSKASTVQELVAETLKAIKDNRRQGTDNNFQNDALSFLREGLGDCTAHANLFAALMRANGVPSRAVTGIQRQSSGQNMHYQNEYYMPGHGWIHVEPQGLAIQTPRTGMVQTGLVLPEMEEHGRGFRQYKGVQQFSMIAHEVDANGQIISEENASVQMSEGLLVKNDPRGIANIHGAT
jgi:hypothetical protein